ncbi:MAG TPA: peptidylprolyl isomerase [Gemmatimonadales bacterium]|nr:peptidylprolyl isomerase [Gemmatimonadales bacterium]
MRSCRLHPIPFVCSAALALLLTGPRPLRAQQADEALVGQLARLLAASDARVFDAAALRDAVASANPDVRRQAALAAGRIGDPQGVDLLVPLLADTVESVRATAAFALGLLKDPRSIEPLMTLVRSGAGATAPAEAVTAVAKIGGDAGARAVAEILQLGNPGVAAPPPVAAALLEAWRLGPRAPVSALVGYADDPDVVTRRSALFSLGRLRTVAGLPALLNALQDRDATVRAVAARGATRALVDSAHLDVPAVADRFRPLLRDPEAAVRINALRSLAGYRDSALAGAVAPLAGDPDVGVAIQAEATLGAMGGSVARTALRARLTAAGFAIRRQALLGLAEADSAAGVAAAAALVADADWRWRSVAAEAFAAAHARDRLEAQLTDADGRVVAQALQGLSRIVPATDTTILPTARRLLAADDAAVRSVAADLLARVPNIDDVDGLAQAYRRAAGDQFDDARLSAVAALAAIAQASGAGRIRVANRFIAATPRADDYLVRRLAAAKLPDAAAVWGPVAPIATGRTDVDYRDAARRYLVPALQGAALPTITIETDRGNMVVQLLAGDAPLTVAAFLGLVDRRFFDGNRWHRVEPNFVVQDGDPRGDGWGGPPFVLRDEVNPVRYDAGIMGMALSGPDTGGSQFFICHSAQPHLDGIYTVFGRVVSGLTVLNQIAQGDRIRSIHR